MSKPTEEILAFRAHLGNYEEQKPLILRKFFFSDHVDQEGLAQMKKLLENYDKVKKDVPGADSGVLEWNEVRQFFGNLNVFVFNDIWDVFQRGPAFGGKKNLTFTEAGMFYLHGNGFPHVTVENFLKKVDLPENAPTKVAYLKAEADYVSEHKKKEDHQAEKDAFLHKKADLQAKKDDPNLPQMRKSQAATELSLLTFDDRGFEHKMTQIDKHLAKVITTRDEAKAAYETELRGYEVKAVQACKAALGLK
eukprot:c5608_g1_i1.p1 GENE.c5608_g1_i1~~c5608_g1_i1.p1  ORF type:complete len:261 (+),score=60.82 c5608_g1_i1:34-783(+)